MGVSRSWQTAVLCALPLMAGAQTNTSGIYLSQFSAGDPQAAAGGTDPVYLVVVEKNNVVVATVNTYYTHPSAGWTSKVWSYGVMSNAALQTGGATLQIVDSFGVCDNTVKAWIQGDNIVIQSLATSLKQGVSNPMAIDCADLYPVPLTRTFTPIF